MREVHYNHHLWHSGCGYKQLRIITRSAWGWWDSKITRLPTGYPLWDPSIAPLYEIFCKMLHSDIVWQRQLRKCRSKFILQKCNENQVNDLTDRAFTWKSPTSYLHSGQIIANQKLPENMISSEVTMRCWELPGVCSWHWSQCESRPTVLQIQIAE